MIKLLLNQWLINLLNPFFFTFPLPVKAQNSNQHLKHYGSRIELWINKCQQHVNKQELSHSSEQSYTKKHLFQR